VFRKLVTLSNGKTEETFRHNSLIDSSNEDVEQLILHSSKSDLGLRRAASIVVVVDTDFSTLIRTSKINLDLSGKVSLGVASRHSEPVVITNNLVPVTLTSSLLARSIGKIAVSGQTIIIIRKRTNTNSSLALSIDHGSLLVHVQHENATATTEASDEDPVHLTRVGLPFDLRRTAARRIIIVDHYTTTPSFVRLRAVVVELKDGIVASVRVACGSDHLVASTDNANPNTLLGDVLARAIRFLREHGVLFHTNRKRTLLDEQGIFASTVRVDSLLIEIDVEVTCIRGILSSDKDVVSLAIFSNESGFSTAILRMTLLDATHLIAITINFKMSLKLVELIACRSSDGLTVTVMSITPPSTATWSPRTIARLSAGIIRSSVARENIGEVLNFFSIPALRVLGFLIRQNGKREIHTLEAWRSSGNSDVIGAGVGIENNLSTKTAIIIVGSDADLTGTFSRAVSLSITLSVNIDDGIIDCRGASTCSGDDLTIHTLKAEVHSVSIGNISALRESAVEVISLTIVVERNGSDNDGLIAEAVGIQRTIFDGKSETTTGIIQTGDEDVIFSVQLRAPLNKGSAIAGIIVISKAIIATTAFGAVSVNRDDSIEVGVAVASVGNKRSASTGKMVPETTSRTESAPVKNVQASASLTLNREG